MENPFKQFLVPGTAGYVAGFWDCVCNAAFSFPGGEMLAIFADETESPRQTLPLAVRRVTYRIVPFYVLAVLALGISVSANDPILTLLGKDDPVRNYPGGFIIMVERAGIAVLPHIINVVMIIAALSTATDDLYVTVRFFSDLSLILESILTSAFKRGASAQNIFSSRARVAARRTLQRRPGNSTAKSQLVPCQSNQNVCGRRNCSSWTTCLFKSRSRCEKRQFHLNRV